MADDLALGVDEQGFELDEAMELLVRSVFAQNSFCNVAVVRAYDRDTQRATVQPVIRGRIGGDPTQYPPITNVPVEFPVGGGHSITWPLAPGDFVQLLHNDRSLDEWESVGGEDVTPADPRRSSITDAVAIPGIRPFNAPRKSVHADGLWVGQDRYDGASGAPRGLLIKSDGKIQLGDDQGNDLVALLHDLVAALQTAQAGPYPLDPVTQAALATLKTKLDTLKI